MSKHDILLVCPSCDHSTAYDSLVLRERARTGQPIRCKHCDFILERLTQKHGASDSQRRSRKQEKRAAAREGGRRQPGSGSVEGFGGDVRAAGRVRGECKLTRAASYTLRLSDLTKLEQQAKGEELPVFEIEFQGVRPHKNYVVLPLWAYETLMTEAGRRPDGR